jgi:hypothetical protein
MNEQDRMAALRWAAQFEDSQTIMGAALAPLLRRLAAQPESTVGSRPCAGCGAKLHDLDGTFHKCPEEKVIITPARIELYGFDRPTTEGEGHTCRTAANEACAWAIKRLGEELEKSVAYVRTGQPIDNVVICN